MINLIERLRAKKCPIGCSTPLEVNPANGSYRCAECNFVGRMRDVDVGEMTATVAWMPDHSTVPHVIRMEAVCGESKPVLFSHTVEPKHDRKPEDLQLEHEGFIQKLAEEVVGHEHSRTLLIEMFAHDKE